MSADLEVAMVAYPAGQKLQVGAAVEVWRTALAGYKPEELEELGFSGDEGIDGALTSLSQILQQLIDEIEGTPGPDLNLCRFGDLVVVLSAGMSSGDPVSALDEIMCVIGYDPQLLEGMTAAGFIVGTWGER